MKKIPVPADLSKFSADALDNAVQLAKTMSFQVSHRYWSFASKIYFL